MSTSLKCLIVGMPSPSVTGEDYKLGEVETVDPSALPFFRPMPDSLVLVVAPLFGKNFDALEILEQLAAQGYRGVLRVIAPHLPNRQIVLRELRSHAARQGIMIELVDLDAPQS